MKLGVDNPKGEMNKKNRKFENFLFVLPSCFFVVVEESSVVLLCLSFFLVFFPLGPAIEEEKKNKIELDSSADTWNIPNLKKFWPKEPSSPKRFFKRGT